MKRAVTVFSMFLIFILCSQLHAQKIPVSDTLYNKIISETVLPYLSALKEGDVSAIKQYIASEMYEKNKGLLEQNKEYPRFLKNYYKGVEFSFENAEEIDGVVIVNMIITYPNGFRSSNKLRMHKERDANEHEVWKVGEFVDN